MTKRWRWRRRVKINTNPQQWFRSIRDQNNLVPDLSNIHQLCAFHWHVAVTINGLNRNPSSLPASHPVRLQDMQRRTRCGRNQSTIDWLTELGKQKTGAGFVSLINAATGTNRNIITILHQPRMMANNDDKFIKTKGSLPRLNVQWIWNLFRSTAEGTNIT